VGVPINQSSIQLPTKSVDTIRPRPNVTTELGKKGFELNQNLAVPSSLALECLKCVFLRT